ncbi:MAG: MBL fold metallo-hydrolase [Aquisalinus sp.]|nr:MBL fold metallo-hydrolase [Aquisalinus sp.]
MKLRAIILGCGSSGGVPRPGGPDGTGNWGACDPSEPKNRRMRCSLLVQRAHETKGWDTSELTTVLVDTSPDLREQLLIAKCGRLDAVLYTHDHADQCHGIDDLRVVALNMMSRVPTYVDKATTGNLLTRFSYCFEQAPGSYYPSILEHREMPENGSTAQIDGPTGPIPFTPFLQHHGNVDSLGFIFGGQGGIAYSSDVHELPEESFQLLDQTGIWIVDALRHKPHVSHAHLDKALDWIARVKPEGAVLTNLHVDMDYRSLEKTLPAGVIPAHDGLILEREILRTAN